MADGSQVTENQSFSRYEMSDSEKRILSRPTLRTPVIEEELLEGLAAGLTLQQVCRRVHMPHRSTVYEWKRLDKEFAERISRARAEGCDALAEQSLSIADNASRDVLYDEDGKPIGSHVAVSRDKLRIDTRLRVAGMWDPKNYGPKSQGDTQVTINLEHLVLASIHAAQPLPAQSNTPQLLNVTPAALDPYEDLL
jgi:hypothetical protein